MSVIAPPPAASSFLSARIQHLAESQTIAMAKRSRELAAQGVDVVNLTFGEPDFPTPQYVNDAAKRALDEGFTYYTPVPGFPELRQAIADKLRRDNQLDFQPNQIVVSTGAKQALVNAVLSIVDPGDEVIVFSPFWVSYEEMVKLAEGTPVHLKGAPENDYKVTAAQLEAAITPRTKAILYSSPCNPTGAVFSRAELEAIAAVVARHARIHVIADEIYEYIYFGQEPLFSIGRVAEIADRVITINGFSKGYAMTGWRVGYLAARPEIAAACDKMQSQVTSGTCSVAQRAALAALLGGRETADEMCAHYLRRRDLLLAKLRDIPGLGLTVPEGAFYLFPDVSAFFGKHTPDGKEIKTVMDLTLFLLSDAHVALVAGDAFGEPRCVRLSYAASDERLVEAARRMKVSLAKLV